jgi:hypothetical protein
MSAKRDHHNPWTGDKRYVRRDNDGRFRESDDVGRSLSYDVRQQGKRKSEGEKGRGDKKA